MSAQFLKKDNGGEERMNFQCLLKSINELDMSYKGQNDDCEDLLVHILNSHCSVPLFRSRKSTSNPHSKAQADPGPKASIQLHYTETEHSLTPYVLISYIHLQDSVLV